MEFELIVVLDKCNVSGCILWLYIFYLSRATLELLL